METIEAFQPVIEPGEELMLHLKFDAWRTLCGLAITATHWLAWGASYPRGELERAASGMICRICIGRVAG